MKYKTIRDVLKNGVDIDNKNPLMVSEHMRALEQFPLNRSLNSFRWHGNPILEKGTSREWDEALIRDPMLFYDYDAPEDEKFKLYYSGQNSDGKMHIGLAYGSSLENLRKHDGNPVVQMTENWENVPTNHNPYVIRVPGTKSYEMLYTACTTEIYGQNRCRVSSTGKVTSTDGKNWTNKKQVFKKFKIGQNTYFPQKPVLHYNVEEGKYYLIFAASLMRKHTKNEGFTGLATSVDGKNYSFKKVIIPQDMSGSIYDPHGLVPLFGWYFLLVTHDSGHAYDFNGNSNWPERWLVSRDIKNWYGSLRSVWDTHPDEDFLYSHLSPLVTESGWAYFVYDHGKPNRFCLAKVPYIGKPYNIIVDEPILKPHRSTKLSDSYPAIRLEPREKLALTCECTYHKKASHPAKIHVYTSYDGKNWDTEEQKDNSGKPVFGNMAFSPGNIERTTRDISIGARFVKVTVKNEDTDQEVRNVKVIATFG
ncbi:MAG: hypothetical protein Q7J67_09075 [bacterium]|nr:hypothetical protein [bacterium]